MRLLLAVIFSLSVFSMGVAYADPFCDFLSIFGLCYVTSEVIYNSDAMYFTTVNIKTEDQTKLKQINLSNIEDGSRIESVGINIMTNEENTKQCTLFLKDKILNEIPISKTFVCAGSKNIQLNELGNDAVENKIGYDDKIEFVIKSDGRLVESNVSITETVYKKPTYFAKIENNIVTNIIVAYKEFVDSQPGQWIETKIDSSVRANYAGVGFTYDSINDVFIPPKKFDSWILNNTSWKYDAPIPYPNDGLSYIWNEEKIGWDLVG